jgi:hypothetical protein
VFSSGDDDLNPPEDDDSSFGIYSGITSEATINSGNAVQLAAGALAGGLMPHGPQGSAPDQAAADSQGDTFRILRFPLTLADSLRRIEPAPAAIFFSRSNPVIESGQFTGSCGGGFSYTLRLDRETQTFKGSLAFADYCADAITISGQTAVDGSFQTGSGNFVSATFRFERLGDGTRSLNGEISMDFSDSPTLATFDATSTDEHTGQVYRIKDYSLNLFELAGTVEIEIFGTFYHPDYGYVRLTTSDPFIVHAQDDWPASGQMAVHGDHSTGAQLRALDHLQYGIEVDSSGDGIFDWDSGALNWNDALSG